MDFEFSADQELLRDSVRRYLADHASIAGHVRAVADDPAGFRQDVWAGLAGLGATGLLIPEAFGGAGGTMVDAGVVLEELGRAAFPGPYRSSAIATASLVALTDDADAHERWLPGLADGSTIGTVALDGLDHVPDAAAADVIFVVQEDDVLAYGAAALATTPVETVDLTRRFGSVDVVGEPLARLAPEPEVLAAVRDRVAIAAVVDGVGAAARALELAVAHAGARIQFDRPVGSFQAVQHLCADMLHDVELARVGAYYALWAADAAPAEERHRAAAMAKAFASDALAGVGASAIQVFGGVGFTWEHDIHLFYKRLLTLQHEGGGTIDHREVVAALILDR